MVLILGVFSVEVSSPITRGRFLREMREHWSGVFLSVWRSSKFWPIFRVSISRSAFEWLSKVNARLFWLSTVIEKRLPKPKQSQSRTPHPYSFPAPTFLSDTRPQSPLLSSCDETEKCIEYWMKLSMYLTFASSVFDQVLAGLWLRGCFIV